MIKFFLLILLTILVLSGCQFKEITPEGKYFLKEGGGEYSLEINAGKTYSMTVVKSGKIEKISGSWEWEENKDIADIILSGIIWRGMDVTAGAGLWPVVFEGYHSSKICLEPEGMTCFEKRR